MKMRVLFCVVMAVSISLVAGPRNRFMVEKKIERWGKERVTELRENKKLDLANEWEKQIKLKHYEWVAANLLHHYATAKFMYTTMKPDKWNMPKMEQEKEKWKRRLADLGWYIQVVNET